MLLRATHPWGWHSGLLRSLPPPQPLGARHRHGVQRQEPRQPCKKRGAEPRRASPGLPAPLPAPLHTQEFLGRPGELRSAAQPVPEPLQVEPRHLLASGVGQGVEAAQLLQVLAVPGSPAVRRHDAVEGAVGAAAEGQTDHDVAAPVALQEPAACGESTGGCLLDGRHPAGSSRRPLTQLHHGARPALSAIAGHGAAPPQAARRGFPLPSRPGREGEARAEVAKSSGVFSALFSLKIHNSAASASAKIINHNVYSPSHFVSSLVFCKKRFN